MDELTRARAERDFYRKLLELREDLTFEPLIERALSLIVEVTGAQQAYIELGTEDDARWWRAHGCDDEDRAEIQASISRGVVSEALSTGRTVVAACALRDPRFLDRESVRRHQIDAVLRAAVGGRAALGVVYLRGRKSAGPFERGDEARVELLAAQLAPLAASLIERQRSANAEDPTAMLRRRLRCEGLVGASEALAHVLEQVSLLAPLDIDVLLTGDSGTGKSALARVIAQNSKRHTAPFVELNCAALPESLFENELFGSARGAHSTAGRAVRGKLAAAEGGTLFLDEVAELSPGAQAKLLNVLQSRSYYPLGSDAALHADVRVIFATNASLEAAVASGRFRRDLFYRINVMPLRMPALAERRHDIPLLVSHCVRRAAERHGLRPRNASPSALMACREAAWPGNVRELAHVVEAAVIRAHGAQSEVVEACHLFPEREAANDGAASFQDATRSFQRELLERTLDLLDWNVSSTARQLGLARSYVYTLIEQHGLKRRIAPLGAVSSLQ